MKKSINIQVTEYNQKYFVIYEVKAVKHNGETVVYEREFNRKKAEKDVDFIYEVHKELYRSAFVTEQIVWC